MASSSTPSSQDVLFREYLWPAWWMWVIVLGAGGAAYFMLAPVGVAAAVTASVVVTLALVVVIINHTLAGRIEVDAEWLRVGRARIERRHVGRVEAFTGDAARAQRGPELNGTAYMNFRGWIDPVVTIRITDPADSTPYWIASTRRPDQLVEALNA